MKIAIIGAGNMGGAIARGLAQSRPETDSALIVSNPGTVKLERLKQEFPHITTTHCNQEAAAGADIVILAVKPWLIESVTSSLELTTGQILVSVAAGVSFQQLQQYVGGQEMAMFRLIPNTAIGCGESMTLLSACHTTPEQEQLVSQLFTPMGRVLLLPEEKLAAATSLTSCGIAYVLKFVQAAMQAGTEMGLRPADSMQLMAQTLRGAAALLQDKETHPAAEIDKVTTPGGITIKGINELEHSGFTSAIIRALKASGK